MGGFFGNNCSFYTLIHLDNKHKALWALAAISFLWGTTWFVSKLIVSNMPPLQMAGLRQTIAGLIVVIYFLLKGAAVPKSRDLLFYVFLGFLLISCSNGLTTWAIKFIPSYLGALISALMPFVMILANFLFFKEKISRWALFGLIIGFSGVLFLLSSFFEELNNSNFIFGVLLTLVGVCTWTTGTLLTIRNKRNLDPYTGIGWQMLFGGLILYFASWVGGQQVPLRTVPLQTWGLIAYLIAVGSIICFMCYLYALKYLPMGMVSIYVYMNPLVALLMGILFLNEKLTFSIVVGALTILVGIYFVKRGTKS
mgnify:FL=1